VLLASLALSFAAVAADAPRSPTRARRSAVFRSKRNRCSSSGTSPGSSS
jgi:hypothetical protein